MRMPADIIHETAARQRTTRRTNLLLFAAILVIINVLGLSLFLRIDLTGRGIFSLSRASKEVVRSLEDRLTIKGYFSEDLPPQFASISRYVRDKMDDYKAFARNRIHFEFVDPATEEELQEEALSYGIQPQQMQVIEQDRMEVKMVYMALVFLYQDRTETIPLVRNTAGLEYDITTAIQAVSRAQKPVTAFLAGHGMRTPDEGPEAQRVSFLKQALERHYDVRTVRVDSFRTVPPEVESLYIIGPTSGFSEWERYAVDQFIMRGGRVSWLIDAVAADLQQSQQGMAQPMPLGMDSWLAHYGIRIRPGLVMDRYNQPVRMGSQRGIFQVFENVPYPFFPNVQNYDREHPLSKDLPEMTFIYASPIDTSLARPDSLAGSEFMQVVPDTIHEWPNRPPRVAVEPIIYTSRHSSLQEEFLFIAPNQAMAEGNFSGGPYPLAATVTGEFTSAFDAAPAVPDSITLPAHLNGPVENRMVVVGDATFVEDAYQQGLGGRNLPFVQNIADWLLQEEGLIAIRAKEIDHRPLAELGNAPRVLVKWLNILLPPLLAILAGVMWWRYRRRPVRQRLQALTATEE